MFVSLLQHVFRLIGEFARHIVICLLEDVQATFPAKTWWE